MPVNASHVAGDAGHVADHNTLAAFVNTHDDVDTATTAHHHTIGTAANQAAAGNHAHAVSAATPTTTVVTGSVTGTSTVPSRDDHVHQMGAHDHSTSAKGGQLSQANTHISADTDSSSTALHHTLGTSSNQAAAGNHAHTGVPAEAPYLVTPGSGVNASLSKYTLSSTGGLIVFTKLSLPNPWTWSGTAIIWCSGFSNSTTAYVGFYADTGSGAPGSLIGTASSGAVTTSASAFTLSGGSASIPAGVVWMAFLSVLTNTYDGTAPTTNIGANAAPFNSTFYKQTTATGNSSLPASAPALSNYSVATSFPTIIAY